MSGSSISPMHGGHEQSGLRPAEVPAVAGMTIGVPLTTTSTAISFPHTHGIAKSSENGLSSDSAALAFPIVALSQDRFVRRIGRRSVEDMEAINVLQIDLLSLE
ncbi:MAG: type II toxin-antitoxin system PemK/MazF family toxin [Methanomicrobiales archaeon]|nr:type II toxin-antitoxin system PemK/MazF family toxin [Methanomicrobiales archaeon]MDI6876287.1 type II toxin-antitoxin system PemK/MazF family toxin [Methanomicrobiales archaeon]